MSTLKTTNLQNPSAASPNIVLGSTGSVAVAGALTGSGMDLINSTAFTAVSSVSLNNVFTTTYDNYRIILTNVAMSSGTPADVNMRLRVAGTDNSTAGNYEWGGTFVGSQASNALGSNNNQVQSYFSFAYGSSAEILSASFDVYSPMLASKTSYNGQSNGYTTAPLAGAMTVTTAYDGFTLYPSAGNFTGTVRVYGYRNA